MPPKQSVCNQVEESLERMRGNDEVEEVVWLTIKHLIDSGKIYMCMNYFVLL